ncbi:MAG: site-specific integrase [Prevotella sp.]|nr:site-specific integrase [Prevotella sp.]
MSHSYLCKAGNNAERQLCASTDFIALILNALRSKTQTTLLSFVDEHISELSTHEGVDMSKSSIWTYKKIRKNLAEFICEKYKLTDLAFGQLTEPSISEFHHYLLDEKGCSSGTIVIYVSLFKKMCRIAFERGLSKNLLFAHYRVGTPGVTTPKALTMSDFIKMLSFPIADERTELARRCFIFASLTSLSYIDVKNLYLHHIGENSEGRKYIKTFRDTPETSCKRGKKKSTFSFFRA